MLAFSARLEKQAPEDDKKGHNLIASSPTLIHNWIDLYYWSFNLEGATCTWFNHVTISWFRIDCFKSKIRRRICTGCLRFASYHSKTMGLYCPGTLPEFRGKGLAQELLRFSIAIAWTKWIRIFLVQTFIMNDGHTKICKSASPPSGTSKKNLCKSPRLDRKFSPSLTHISFSV